MPQASRKPASLLCALLLSAGLTACGGSAPMDKPENAATHQAVTAQQEATAAPLPVMPPRGVNTDTLFAEKLRSDEDRFARLETIVTQMKHEQDAVLQAISRLAALEHNRQGLTQPAAEPVATPPLEAPAVIPAPVKFAPAAAPLATPVKKDTAPAKTPAPVKAAGPQMTPAPVSSEDAVTNTAAKATPAPAAVTTPPAPPPAQTAAPATKGAIVQNIRTGLHGDITRLVIDLAGASTYRHDLDNTEHLLIVELPEATPPATLQGTMKSPLLASWTAQLLEAGKGTRLIVTLKQDAAVVKAETLTKPDRIVLDLKRK